MNMESKKLKKTEKWDILLGTNREGQFKIRLTKI